MSNTEEFVFKPFNVELLSFDWKAFVAETNRLYARLYPCEEISDDDEEDASEDSCETKEHVKQKSKNTSNVRKENERPSTSGLKGDRTKGFNQNEDYKGNNVSFKVSNVTDTVIRISKSDTVDEDETTMDFFRGKRKRHLDLDSGISDDSSKDSFNSCSTKEDPRSELSHKDCEMCCACNTDATFFCAICDKRFCEKLLCQECHSCRQNYKKFLRFLN